MSGKIVLTVITQAHGNGLESLLKKAEKFEAETSEVEVRIEQAQGNFEVFNKMKSGEPGDLIHLSESVFAPYLRQGLIIDLMPFLEEDRELSADDFYRGALEGPSDQGKLAALPIDIAVPLIYYRKKAFEEAGISEPVNGWTFEQFEEAALRLTSDSQYGLRIGVDIEWFEPFVKRSGGAYLSPDGSTSEGFSDSGETAAALQRIVNWFRLHRFAPMPGEAGEKPFTGQFAMVYDFSWWIPHVWNNLKGEYGVIGLPRAAEGTDTTMVYMGGYGISTGCKHPDLAWRLLKELSVPAAGHPLSALPATKPIAHRLGGICNRSGYKQGEAKGRMLNLLTPLPASPRPLPSLLNTIRQSNPRSSVGTKTKAIDLLCRLYSLEGQYSIGQPANLDPEHFAYHRAEGMCARCYGRGYTMEIDIRKLMPDTNRSLEKTSHMNILPCQLCVPPLMHGIPIIENFFIDWVIMSDIVPC